MIEDSAKFFYICDFQIKGSLIELVLHHVLRTFVNLITYRISILQSTARDHVSTKIDVDM